MCANSNAFALITVELTTPPPECRVDEECSDALACVAQQCKNPCAIYDNCAPNAECHVTRHRPVCSCPDGFVGNPNIQCLVGKMLFKSRYNCLLSIW